MAEADEYGPGGLYDDGSNPQASDFIPSNTHITPNIYQQLTEQTEIYSVAAYKFLHETPIETQEEYMKIMYCTVKLNGEAGEVAELVGKALRDGTRAGYFEPERIELIKKELGDCLWYIARLSDLFGFRLEDVMNDNIKKLLDRKERDKLTGSGNER